MTQLADFVGPETVKEMIRAFGSDVVIPQPVEDGVEDISSPVGLVTGEHIWDMLWRFGIVVDNDVQRQRSCGDLWRPDGRIANGYYIPDDEDTEYPCYSIDSPPPKVAWDAT